MDSTSAPVACVASFISTWIAFQLSLIRAGFSAAGLEANAYTVFTASMPANFYCWLTILRVFLTIRRSWRPGPMARAVPEPADGAEISRPPSAAWRGTVPVAFLIAAIFAGLYLDGPAGHSPAQSRK